MIELGDYVQSTENPGITYIVIGLKNNKARVRVLYEHVYTCDLNILKPAGV